MTAPYVRAIVIAGALIAAGCAADGSVDDAVGATTVETIPGSVVREATAPESTTASDATAATDATGDEPMVDADADVHRVPDEFATIAAAVAAAAPGDLVLVSPGVYRESVDVEVENLTIRGTDRDAVVLDGELDLDNGIRVLGVPGVAVENLTVTNYTNNGVFWIRANGYRASYVTTYRTGNYGIYAFDSVRGLIEHSTTIGSREAGVYIGQCFPCDAVVRSVTSSHNGLGYSGTNAGGNLLVIESDWHDNRLGLVPNSGTYELCYPQRDTTIVGNRVWGNNRADASPFGNSLLAPGNGILVAGGIANRIERNRVDDHDRTGIALVPFAETVPVDQLPTEEEWELTCAESRDTGYDIPDEPIIWESYDNVVIGNVVTGSGEADIASAASEGTAERLRTCLDGNEAATTAPTALADLAPCAGDGSNDDWAAGDLDVMRWIDEQAELPPEPDWQTAPLPTLGPQEQMDDAGTAPARPATDVPPEIDLDAVDVPTLDPG